MEWMILLYKRYAEFDGRSRRMEYWMFTLFSLIVMAVCVGLMFAGGLLGRITKLEGDYAVVELTDNVEVKIQKAAVLASLPKGTLKSL